MSVFRTNISSARFTAGQTDYSRTSSLLNIIKPDRGVVQKSYDALSHAWELVKAGWPMQGPAVPSITVLTDHAFSERIKMVRAQPNLEGVLTNEMVAKAAWIALLSQKLDERCITRLSRLVRSEDDWDGEGARAMSVAAIANFSAFIERGLSLNNKPSLFLGSDGEIVASWQLDNGSTLDMVFGDQQIELATDEHDEIFALGDARIYSIVAEL
ncbi:hypothetical protein [Pseudomonas sp. ICMP 10191]|uniref:hypothetical protein n=1 Tax=Pseudomonas sp. ICMP 10191 TaxID=1198294 RepID=UPI0007313675|nr:hypothetical protein [Pseudomonas sp. ICMP 10191]KTC13865.1 hypothetical protein AO388_06215 [Pseudomonas sp. ICMP 10191]